jgi:hypothetical protein
MYWIFKRNILKSIYREQKVILGRYLKNKMRVGEEEMVKI